jgi:hypothetical protein
MANNRETTVVLFLHTVNNHKKTMILSLHTANKPWNDNGTLATYTDFTTGPPFGLATEIPVWDIPTNGPTFISLTGSRSNISNPSIRSRVKTYRIFYKHILRAFLLSQDRRLTIQRRSTRRSRRWKYKVQISWLHTDFVTLCKITPHEPLHTIWHTICSNQNTSLPVSHNFSINTVCIAMFSTLCFLPILLASIFFLFLRAPEKGSAAWARRATPAWGETSTRWGRDVLRDTMNQQERYKANTDWSWDS